VSLNGRHIQECGSVRGGSIRGDDRAGPKSALPGQSVTAECALSDCGKYSCRNRSHGRLDRARAGAMEALGGLAVAERDIRALSTARADRARAATLLASLGASPPRPSSPPGGCFVEPATDHSTSRQPVKPDLPWRTERARAGGAQFSRLSGPYSRECGAVLLFEREYPAQRPPAARGLSSHDVECGAVSGSAFFQATTV